MTPLLLKKLVEASGADWEEYCMEFRGRSVPDSIRDFAARNLPNKGLSAAFVWSGSRRGFQYWDDADDRLQALLEKWGYAYVLPT